MEERETNRAPEEVGVEVQIDETGNAQEPGCEESAGAHIRLGRKGELAAQRFLQNMGYEILETNWSCLAGEVDVIVRDECSIHFVEVKTRRGVGKGFPVEAVTPEKRRKYERIAELYLQHFEPIDCSVHFDIISILVLDEHRGFLKMYANAFGFDG